MYRIYFMAIETRAYDGSHIPQFLLDDEATTRKILPQAETTVFIDPKTITRESFLELDGLMQETILISLLTTGNSEKVGNLRPDFQMDRQLTFDEERMAKWTWEITQGEKPLTTPLHDMDNPSYALIHRTVFSMPKEELTGILERERQRRMLFAPGMFSPAEDIGKFRPAIRYRGILENHIEEDNRKPLKKAA